MRILSVEFVTFNKIINLINYFQNDIFSSSPLCNALQWVIRRDRDIVVTETVKGLNILQFAFRKHQNKGVHKGHIFVLRQVTCKELESLQFTY